MDVKRRTNDPIALSLFLALSSIVVLVILAVALYLGIPASAIERAMVFLSVPWFVGLYVLARYVPDLRDVIVNALGKPVGLFWPRPRSASSMYCEWVGVSLLALGVLDQLAPGVLSYQHSATRTLIHIVSGATLAYSGFTRNATKIGSQIFGVIYTVVAILGFISGATVPFVDVPVSFTYNVIHLVIGVLGLLVGFGAREMAHV